MDFNQPEYKERPYSILLHPNKQVSESDLSLWFNHGMNTVYAEWINSVMLFWPDEVFQFDENNVSKTISLFWVMFDSGTGGISTQLQKDIFQKAELSFQNIPETYIGYTKTGILIPSESLCSLVLKSIGIDSTPTGHYIWQGDQSLYIQYDITDIQLNISVSKEFNSCSITISRV